MKIKNLNINSHFASCILFFFIGNLFPMTSVRAQGRTIKRVVMADTSFSESMYLGLPFVTDLDTGYKGIPQGLINIKIKKYYFQLDQFAYQEYKQGYFTKERFMRYYNHARADTNLLSKTPLKNYIGVLTGVTTTDKQKIMIPDLNADHNFSNDPVIILQDSNRDYHTYQYIGVQFINNKKVIEKTAWVSPGPEMIIGYINNGREIKDTLTPLQVKEDNKSGIFEAEGRYYNFIVIKPFTDLFYKEKNIELIYYPEKSRYSSTLPIYTFIRYRFGDSLSIGKYNYLFLSMAANGDTLYLKELNRASRGYYLGYSAFPIRGANILTGNIINTEEMKKSYLLLDFWGTWCEPCREITPYLKKLYRSYRNKNLKIIGIAYDKSLQPVRSYLKNEKISWINLFDKRDSHGICEHFMIQAFPTFILVDPEGKIVLRGSGKDYFKNIQSYLAEHVKQ